MGVALEIAGEATISTDPGEGALDDPALGENREVMQLRAVDDLDSPGARLRDRGGERTRVIAGIGEDALDEGEEVARAPVEDQPGAITILHVGRMDDDIQQETDRVDENMPLPARDLLARIEALRVKRGAPF